MRHLTIAITCGVSILTNTLAASAGNITYNLGFSVPMVDQNSDLPPGGDIHVSGTITSDGTLGKLLEENIVDVSLTASYQTATVGPLVGSDSTNFTMFFISAFAGDPVLYTSVSRIYWNTFPVTSEHVSDFVFDIESLDGEIEESIFIRGSSGFDVVPQMYVEMYRLNEDTEEYVDVRGRLILPNEQALVPLGQSSIVPEPSTLALALIAGIGFVWHRRRR